MSKKENTQIESSLLQNNNNLSTNSTIIKCQTKKCLESVSCALKWYRGENTISKYQRTEEFTRKVCALLYYIYMTKKNWINYNWLRVLIMHFYRLVRFHTQRRCRSSLSVRLSDLGHPVMYIRFFCRNNPGHKIYRCMSVRSTQHHTLLPNPTIIHTKTFFTPAFHPRQIYRCMSARSTQHRTLLHW